MSVRYSQLAMLYLLASLLTSCTSDHPGVATFSPSLPQSGSIEEHVERMWSGLNNALYQANSAVASPTVKGLQHHVRQVHNTLWGTLAMPATAALPYPDWKSQWQVSYTEFDPDFAQRYGDTPPALTPQQLGIVGNGRGLRRLLLSAGADPNSGHVAALNNLIGWMRIDDGVTKAERQPRIDLTYRWDAPNTFWLSTRDTGWLFEVHAQASNIAKTNYGDNLATARQHTAELQALIQKCLQGTTQDGTRYPGLQQIRDGLMQEQRS